MKKRSDCQPDWKDLRDKIIGLGETSIRKSYYPELQQQHAELIKKNEELQAAYEELTATDEELRQQYEELQKTEQELRESRKSYLRIAEMALEGIWVVDCGYNIVFVNPHMAEMLGYSVEEMVGHHASEFIAEDDRAGLPARIENRKKGIRERFENRFVRRDGAIVTFLVSASPVIGEDGSFKGSFAMFTDITDRKKVEEKLRQSEERLRLFIRHAPAALAMFDREMRYIAASRRWMADYHLGDRDIIGRSHYEVFPEISEELKEIHRRSLAGEVLSGDEDRFVRKDGSVQYLAWEVRPWYTTDNSIGGIIIFSEDITERNKAKEALKENEKFLSNLIGNIPDMIFVKDAKNLRFVRFNKAGEELLGYSSGELLGKNDYDFFPKDEADFFTKKDREVLNTRKPADIPEEKIQTRHRGERILHTKKIPILDEQGNPAYLMGISEDITEQKRTEEALKLAWHKLTLLNAITFQDIQTAAFSLSAYHELVKTLVTDEKAKTYLEKQGAANQKILDTLNFAKNYQDMGIQSPRWQNVNQVFLLAISHLDFLQIHRSCQVEGLEIYADPLFENVLYHLMQNVLRHGVNATAVRLYYEEKTDGLVLFIEDNGVGIPTGEKHMIFDRGYGRNTGLGLFLAREVLSITGIGIRETGEPGRGARFELTVPKGIYRFTHGT